MAKAHADNIRAAAVEAELRVEMKLKTVKGNHAEVVGTVIVAKKKLDTAAAAYQAAEEELKQLVIEREEAERLQHHSKVLLGQTLEEGIKQAQHAMNQVKPDVARLRKVEQDALHNADIAGARVLEAEHVIELIIQEKQELQAQIAGTENKVASEQRTQDQSTECIAQNHKWMEQVRERQRIAQMGMDEASAGLEVARVASANFAKEAAALSCDEGWFSGEGARGKEAEAEEEARVWSYKYDQAEQELVKAKEVLLFFETANFKCCRGAGNHLVYSGSG